MDALERKRLGSWYTPPELIDRVIGGVLDGFRPRSRTVRVLDPSCGDGRFLSAIADRLTAAGASVELVGCDVDQAALNAITDRRIDPIHDDALTHRWTDGEFDIVVGNPPFLSQMATSTTRGGASSHGGGPYADAAAEFLALSVRLAQRDGGRIALVLPQSLLGARDAEPVRRDVERVASLTWSWWAPKQQHFDASVNVCAIGLERSVTERQPIRWTSVVTDVLGVPQLDLAGLATNGTLAERADLNANFRDEYYALVPAVSDSAAGPPLVTSGLIDPGVCHWGARSVRFAKHDFARPRVALDRLTGRFPAWAARKLVPKVLIANQTKVIEAVADPDGAWLPGVPVTTATPHSGQPAGVWEIAAVLTCPVATIGAWQHGAGTGMSTRTVRLGPVSLGATPWPSGSLDRAVRALRTGDVATCAREVTAAYSTEAEIADDALTWWNEQRPAADRTATTRR